MKLEELLANPPTWLEEDFPLADKIIFSRAKVVRNLMDFPFPNQSTPEGLHAVMTRVKVASRYVKPLQPYIFVELKDIPSDLRAIIFERGIPMSHLLRDSKGDLMGRALIIREDEKLIVMVNDEEHLTIQATMPGLALKDALSTALSAAKIYEKLIEMAYIDTIGFLASNPVETGLGITLGVMLHLPGISLTQQLKAFLELFRKSKFLIRNYFMDTTAGHFFYLHSVVKLGLSEEELYQQFAELVDTILDLENESSDHLNYKFREVVEDKVARSVALLKSAKLLSFAELVEAISYLRLGLKLDMLNGLDYKKLNEVLFLTQPAHIKRFVDRPEISKEELELYTDKIRAVFVRSKLKLN